MIEPNTKQIVRTISQMLGSTFAYFRFKFQSERFERERAAADENQNRSSLDISTGTLMVVPDPLIEAV